MLLCPRVCGWLGEKESGFKTGCLCESVSSEHQTSHCQLPKHHTTTATVPAKQSKHISHRRDENTHSHAFLPTCCTVGSFLCLQIHIRSLRIACVWQWPTLQRSAARLHHYGTFPVRWFVKNRSLQSSWDTDLHKLSHNWKSKSHNTWWKHLGCDW